MSQGFIQLYRKILDEWFWSDSKLCHLMITLILEANHQLQEVSFQGKKRTIGVGETIRTTRQLASITGIPKSSISRMLKNLCEANEIKILETKASHIKILRYHNFLTSDLDENWDKDGTGMGLNNNDNNNTNNNINVKSVEDVVAEIMDDKLFMDEINNMFRLRGKEIEDQIDHMYHSYREKNKNSYNWKASFKNWLHIGRKIEHNYAQKEMAKSDAYDNPE